MRVPDEAEIASVVRLEQMLRHYTGRRMPEATIGRITRTELAPSVGSCRTWIARMAERHPRDLPPWARELNSALNAPDRDLADRFANRGRATADARGTDHARVAAAIATVITAVRTTDRVTGPTPYDRDGDQFREAAFAQFPMLLKTALAAQLNVLDVPPMDAHAAMPRDANRPAGERVYDALHAERPSWLQRLIGERTASQPGTLNQEGEAAIAPLVALARGVVRNVTQENSRGPEGRLALWIEAHLPDARAIRSTDALWRRVDDLKHLGVTLERILLEERRYARTIGLGPAQYDGIQRAPIIDVVMATAHERVLSHADPFTVFRESMIATRGQGEAVVARAIELALMRRLDELLGDKPDPASLERRPVGWEIESNRRRPLLQAFNENRLPAELARTERVLGERDPENQRIVLAATRLFESSMLLRAVAEFRPVASGLPATSSLRWPRALAKIAEQALVETEGKSPLTSDGTKIPWTALVERHPDFKKPPASAVSWLDGAPPVLEPTVPGSTI
jgi:hypothetical protein